MPMPSPSRVLSWFDVLWIRWVMVKSIFKTTSNLVGLRAYDGCEIKFDAKLVLGISDRMEIKA